MFDWYFSRKDRAVIACVAVVAQLVELSVVVRVVVGSSPIGRPIANLFLPYSSCVMNSFPQKLFTDLMRFSPFQPATNLWRAVELTFLLEKALPLLARSKEGLDLGCGDGQIMKLLRPFFPKDMKLNGIDIDEAEIKLAKQTQLYNHVYCTSGTDLPLEEGSQDFVISNSVLEHVDPIHQVLDESARVLKKDGLFIATVPSDSFHDCLNGSWLPHISKEKYNNVIDRRLAHLRYWNEKEWRASLETAGIRLTHCLPYLTEKETQRWELLSRLTGGLLYTLRGSQQRPIIIQRSMGMRQGQKLPKWIAYLISKICLLALSKKVGNKHGCVLVIGRKI